VYDLQNENLEQLKHNNDALKESNGLLQEQVSGLRKENESLKKQVGELSQKVAQIDDSNASSSFSEAADALLGFYHQEDTTDLWKDDIISALCDHFGTIQIESAIDELKSAKMISLASVSLEGNMRYSLTVQGKKSLADYP
jgi:predicted nuclease with TOPRIM domain